MTAALCCPICRRSFDPELCSATPFCSERCRSVDLGRWFNEEYGLPHTAVDADDEDPAGDQFSAGG